MVRISTYTTALLVTIATTATAFVPSSNSPSFVNRQIISTPTSSSLEAAPTMVVYWSIKTAFDTLMYAAGQTDEVKGTGVWKDFELKRDPDDKKDDSEKKDDEK